MHKSWTVSLSFNFSLSDRISKPAQEKFVSATVTLSLDIFNIFSPNRILLIILALTDIIIKFFGPNIRNKKDKLHFYDVRSNSIWSKESHLSFVFHQLMDVDERIDMIWWKDTNKIFLRHSLSVFVIIFSNSKLLFCYSS